MLFHWFSSCTVLLSLVFYKWTADADSVFPKPETKTFVLSWGRVSLELPNAFVDMEQFVEMEMLPSFLWAHTEVRWGGVKMVCPELESVWCTVKILTVSAFFFIFLVLFVHWKLETYIKLLFSWGSESLLQKHLVCLLVFLQSEGALLVSRPGSSQRNKHGSFRFVEMQSASI